MRNAVSLVCQICGCTEQKPCQITEKNLKTGVVRKRACQWFDTNYTLCSNPRCIAQMPLEELEMMVEQAIAEEQARMFNADIERRQP
jgi:hypothetical protein